MLATSIVALTARSVASSSGPGPPHDESGESGERADSAEANPAPDAISASSFRLRRSSMLWGAAWEDGSELKGHRQRRRYAIAPPDERAGRGIVTEL